VEGLGSVERSAIGWNIALRLHTVLNRTVRSALQHDCINVAQATAYSAMLSLFPALIVSAAIISLLPEYAPIRGQLDGLFDRILPEQVSPLVQSYFDASPHTPHTLSALAAAAAVSLFGGTSLIATLMDGLARAQGLSKDVWSFWQKRKRAFYLVLLLLLPLVGSSLLVMFGDLFATWMASHAPARLAVALFVVTTALRWSVAIAACVGLMATLYRNAVPNRQSWTTVMPGALTATLLWLVATLGFGWYARHFANYSRVYGSLGVGIALLIWLYILFLSVLSGAEFNAHFFEVCVWEPNRGVAIHAASAHRPVE
jgi:membrane protein